MIFYKVRDEGKTEQEDREYRGAKGLSKDLKGVIEPCGFQAEGTASVRPWGGRVPGVCRKPRTPADGVREGGRVLVGEELPEEVSRGRQIMGP